MPFTETHSRKSLFFLIAQPASTFVSSFCKFLFIVLLFLSAALQSSAQKQPSIKLRSGIKAVNTDILSEKIKTHLRKTFFNGNSYTIIQFNKLPGAGEVAKLKEWGIELLQYIPDNAYWARLTDKATPAQLKVLGVRGIYEPQAEDKLSQKLKLKLDESTSNKSVNYLLVNISCFRENKESIKKQLRTEGAVIINPEFEDQNIFQAKINIQDLTAIASLPFVSFINIAAEKSTSLLYVTNATHNVHALTSTIGAARGLSGTNIFVGMGDEGNPTSHIDLVDRTINKNPLPYVEHSTNVEGVLAGGGLRYEIYKGVAPKATVISQYFDKMITNTPVYFND
ncbi:MAG: hypothetical protein HYX40_10110, partial [Sphingobacteriales bacterium]|nr:hypothetical protein [Sphingobacteriales bacterium]